MNKPTLLSIIEIGGYPNFRELYERAGYEVIVASKMRKAMALIKKHQPEFIVAEFNFQSDFRDRTSSLESMMSVAERLPNVKVIVFYEKEYRHQLDRLLEHRQFYKLFAFPISEVDLTTALIGSTDVRSTKKRPNRET